jgi:hypothetical protein
MLNPGECVIADRGYKGEPRVHTPYHAKDMDHYRAMSVARARHETVNGRFKHWNVLRNMYRHDRNNHYMCFGAVAAITQIELQTGMPLFDVDDYKDPAFV